MNIRIGGFRYEIYAHIWQHGAFGVSRYYGGKMVHIRFWRFVIVLARWPRVRQEKAGAV